MFKVLVADKMAEEGLQVLGDHSEFEFDVKLKLPPDDLVKVIADYDVLLVRSDTKATAEVIEAGKKLKIIDPWNEKMKVWNRIRGRGHAKGLGVPSGIISFSK